MPRSTCCWTRPYGFATTLAKFINEALSAGSTVNNFLASKDAPEWAVYLFTKAMHERKDEFIDENPPARTWNPEADVELNSLNPVPLHPGAERCFREIDWIK